MHTVAREALLDLRLHIASLFCRKEESYIWFSAYLPAQYVGRHRTMKLTFQTVDYEALQALELDLFEEPL